MARRYSHYSFGYDDYPRQMSVATRVAHADRSRETLRRDGHKLAPVVLEGRTIASTFWGKSWCQNLEAYSDYANRIPRGRSYVRSGSVLDLQIAGGVVEARVSGSRLYSVTVKVSAVPSAHWKKLVGALAGETLSMVDLLSGHFSDRVMQRFCQQGEGLFPQPREIAFECSCPDWAGMCKHVAATLYGVGNRLDRQPELLFTMRGVDPLDLVGAAATAAPTARPKGAKVLDEADLAGVFGIDLGVAEAPAAKAKRRTRSSAKAGAKKEPSAGKGKRSRPGLR